MLQVCFKHSSGTPKNELNGQDFNFFAQHGKKKYNTKEWKGKQIQEYQCSDHMHVKNIEGYLPSFEKNEVHLPFVILFHLVKNGHHPFRKKIDHL